MLRHPSMNTALPLRTRTIYLVRYIFKEGTFYGSTPGGVHQLWEGCTWPTTVCTLPAPALYIYIGILSDSVGTSHLRLIGKKRRKHQPRGWTCNTERSSKKCQHSSHIFTRGCWSPMVWNLQQRNIENWKGNDSFLLWNEPTPSNTPNYPPVCLGVRGQKGTRSTSCYQKWPNRASRLPYLLDAFIPLPIPMVGVCTASL